MRTRGRALHLHHRHQRAAARHRSALAYSFSAPVLHRELLHPETMTVLAESVPVSASALVVLPVSALPSFPLSVPEHSAWASAAENSAAAQERLANLF